MLLPEFTRQQLTRRSGCFGHVWQNCQEYRRECKILGTSEIEGSLWNRDIESTVRVTSLQSYLGKIWKQDRRGRCMINARHKDVSCLTTYKAQTFGIVLFMPLGNDSTLRQLVPGEIPRGDNGKFLVLFHVPRSPAYCIGILTTSSSVRLGSTWRGCLKILRG